MKAVYTIGSAALLLSAFVATWHHMPGSAVLLFGLSTVTASRIGKLQ